MKSQKNLYVIIFFTLVFATALYVGFFSAKNSELPPIATPTPLPAETPPVQPVALPTVSPEIYKIQLSGDTLTLIHNGTTIGSAEITPDVYPYNDIKALSEGIIYSSYEEVMADWESLCS